MGMEKKSGWDNIPSLEGLGVDWDFKPEAETERRTFRRMNRDDIARLFDMDTIVIKLATAQQTYDGHLVDISDGGVGLKLPVLLQENEFVKIGLMLGSKKIVTKGLVKHVSKTDRNCKAGIKFVDIAKDSMEFIAGLYASKVFLHAH